MYRVNCRLDLNTQYACFRAIYGYNCSRHAIITLLFLNRSYNLFKKPK